MDISALVSSISTVGFPIVAFFVAIYALKYAFDTSIKQNEKSMEELSELTKAVNNNTVVLTQLVEKLEGST